MLDDFRSPRQFWVREIIVSIVSELTPDSFVRQLSNGGDSLRKLSKVESTHLKCFNYIEASAVARVARFEISGR